MVSYITLEFIRGDNMKVIYSKDFSPFLENVAENTKNGREQWNIARHMQENSYINHQPSTEILLFERGAYADDPYSMCELAKYYFNSGDDVFLPQALMWWKKACLVNDDHSLWYIKNAPIKERILQYKTKNSAYANAEMRCAMLAELHTDCFGIIQFDKLSDSEKMAKLQSFSDDFCLQMSIPKTEINFIPNLKFENRMVDGLSGPQNSIDIRKELLNDKRRLILVLAHELGHQIEFATAYHPENTQRLKKFLDIQTERIEKWTYGLKAFDSEIFEIDADSVAYGIWWNWRLFFE